MNKEGDLPEGWRIKKLEEVCKTKPQSGGTPLTSRSEYYENGSIPWVITEDLTQAGMYIKDTKKKITKIGLENSSARWFPKGTILFAMYGSIGRMSITEIELTTNQAILGIVPDENQILTKYLYYYLEFAKKHLIESGRGGTQANVNAKMVKEFQVAYPPIPIQQKIVAKLDAFFENYNEMKKQHELEKARVGKIMQAAIIKLIPDPEDELPEGRQVKKLEEIADFLDNKRKPINEKERRERLEKATVKYPYYGANGQVGWIDDYIFDEELVLLAEDGGFFGSKTKQIAYLISGKSWVNNHAHVLKAKQNSTNKWLLYSLMFYDIADYVGGTTRLKLNKSDAEELPIVTPPLKTQQKIVAKLDAVAAESRSSQDEVMRKEHAIELLPNVILRKAFRGELVN